MALVPSPVFSYVEIDGEESKPSELEDYIKHNRFEVEKWSMSDLLILFSPFNAVVTGTQA